MIAPCKDCMKRKIGCHSNCKEYQNWKSRDEEEVEYVEYLKGAIKRMKGSSRWA